MSQAIPTLNYARPPSPWQVTPLNLTALGFGCLLAVVSALLPDWFFTGKGFVPWQWMVVMVVWVLSTVFPIAMGIESIRRSRRLLVGGWALALVAIALGCANAALGWKMGQVAGDRYQQRWEAAHAQQP
jgi:hypothetical protein